MLFTDLKSQKSYINNIVERTRNHQPVFSISNRFLNSNTNANTNTIVNANPTNTVANEVQPKKMKWGEPTWVLFHCLAEKVKEEYFFQIREELLSTIYYLKTQN